MKGFDIDRDGSLVKCWLDRETVVIPDGVKRIRRLAFPSHMPKIRRLVIPGSVERIDCQGLHGAKFLEELELHEGLRSVSMRFVESKDLKSVRFPSTMRAIGDAAFLNTKVQEFIFPPGLDTDNLFLDGGSLMADWKRGEEFRVVWPYGPEANKAGLDVAFSFEKWVHCVSLEADRLDPLSMPPEMKTAAVRGFVNRVRNNVIPETEYLGSYWELVLRFIFKNAGFLPSDPYGWDIPWPKTPHIRDCALCLIRSGSPLVVRDAADRLLELFRDDIEVRLELLEALRPLPSL